MAGKYGQRNRIAAKDKPYAVADDGRCVETKNIYTFKDKIKHVKVRIERNKIFNKELFNVSYSYKENNLL